MAEEKLDFKKGPSSGSDRFVQLLLEIEAAGLDGRASSGALDGPFFSKVVFGCVIRIGVGDEFR